MASPTPENAFSAKTVHDVRTSLNNIIGFAELLGAESLDADTRRRYADAIVSSGQSLLRLVESPNAAPVAPPAPIPAAPRPAAPAAAAGAPLRLLLVDDMDLNLIVVRNLLARQGVKDVVTAHSGAEALAALEREGAAFTAVLTDIWMPEMDGVGLLKAIRADARRSALPVFAVTADAEIVKTYAELGFTGLLLKPLTLDVVGGFVRGFAASA